MTDSNQSPPEQVKTESGEKITSRRTMLTPDTWPVEGTTRDFFSPGAPLAEALRLYPEQPADQAQPTAQPDTSGTNS